MLYVQGQHSDTALKKKICHSSVSSLPSGGLDPLLKGGTHLELVSRCSQTLLIIFQWVKAEYKAKLRCFQQKAAF